jgi:putative phosphoesterase
MKTIGIISDTHIRAGGRRQLPQKVFEVFAGVDFILHGGDVTDESVITDLEAIAPLYGVHGNNDGWGVLDKWPATQFSTVEECAIGLVHGHLAKGRSAPLDIPGNRETAGHALSHFLDESGAPTADCVIFGHSHRPAIHWHEVKGRKILLFNPGSPTDRRYAPQFGLGLLHVDNHQLKPELILW